MRGRSLSVLRLQAFVAACFAAAVAQVDGAAAELGGEDGVEEAQDETPVASPEPNFLPVGAAR